MSALVVVRFSTDKRGYGQPPVLPTSLLIVIDRHRRTSLFKDLTGADVQTAWICTGMWLLSPNNRLILGGYGVPVTITSIRTSPPLQQNLGGSKPTSTLPRLTAASNPYNALAALARNTTAENPWASLFAPTPAPTPSLIPLIAPVSAHRRWQGPLLQRRWRRLRSAGSMSRGALIS